MSQIVYPETVYQVFSCIQKVTFVVLRLFHPISSAQRSLLHSIDFTALQTYYYFPQIRFVAVHSPRSSRKSFIQIGIRVENGLELFREMTLFNGCPTKAQKVP